MRALIQLLQSLSCSLLLSAALLLNSGCSDSADIEQAESQASEFRIRAESYLRQGQLRSALIELQNAEQARPGQPDTLALMARTFYALGALDKSLNLYEKLAEADKLDAQSRAGFVRSLVRAGRFGKAEQVAGQAQSPELDGLRSQILLGLGQRLEAAKLAEQVLNNDPAQLDALVTYTNIRLLEDDEAGFQDGMSRLAELDRPQAWLWRARMQQARNENDAAISSLSRALEYLNSQDVMTADRFEALRRMMNALIAEGRTDEAMGYSGILAGSSAGQLANQYDSAVSQIREGNLDEASALFEEILTRSPSHQGSNLALGLIAFQQQDYQRAQQYLDSAVSSGNSSVTAIKYLVSVQLQRGDNQAALAQLEKAMPSYPGDPDLLALKGLALQRSGAAKEAEVTFKSVLEAEPGNVGANISLGQLTLERGDLEQSERYFRQALAIAPRVPGALIGLVDVADARGLRGVGMAELRQQASEAGSAELWVLAAMTSLRFDQREAAREDARQALTLEPGQPRARAILGALDYLEARQAFSAGRYEQSGQFARQALNYMPDHLGLILLSASAASAAGNNDQALEIARSLQARNPQGHHGHELEGDILFQQGARQAAVTAYEQAWDLHRNPVLAAKYTAALRAVGADELEPLQAWTEAQPDNPQAWLVLASHAEHGQQSALAIEGYQQAAQLAPDNAAILNNLAWQYFLAGDERAEQTAADAYALAPENPAIADTYGWILYQAGQRERALALLQQAARGAPDDSTIQAHLREAEAGGP